MAITLPGPLVETEWLHQHLGEPRLRILDCTVFLRPRSSPDPGDRRSWIQESGRTAWELAHIPGSSFVDLARELSDQDARLPFMMPPAEQFERAMAAHGVGDDSTVVCYDAAGMMWAARVWWMLRAFGFESAAVLNGGWRKWQAEGRPVSTEAPAATEPGHFTARPRPERIASKEDVLAAIGDGETCIVNALTPEQHSGKHGSPYGRPGRIPSSVNLSAQALIDPGTHAYRPLEEIRRMFDATGRSAAARVITYCGGGIAASSDALVLTLLGYDNVAVYDGSLSEWARDDTLPIETD